MSEPISTQERLRGDLVERGRAKDEGENVAYLNNTVLPLAEKYGGFGNVLGGDSPLSMETNYALDLGPFLKDQKYVYHNQSMRLRSHSFARAWNTGADLNGLVEDSPNDRYKFYLSLNLETPYQMQKAQAMFREILELCREQKVSLLTKSGDHNYDSCNLYTWDRQKMADILEKIYPKYPEIWLNVHHFFQGKAGSINPMHIGFVQEPVGGVNGRSHSGRMEILGNTLDSQSPQRVTVETYKAACLQSKVKPHAPWLVAA